MAAIAELEQAWELPAEWMSASRLETVLEYLKWLPIEYAGRRQWLIWWAGRVGIELQSWHYQRIARSNDVYAGARD